MKNIYIRNTKITSGFIKKGFFNKSDDYATLVIPLSTKNKEELLEILSNNKYLILDRYIVKEEVKFEIVSYYDNNTEILVEITRTRKQDN